MATDRKFERKPLSYPGWIELGPGKFLHCSIDDVSEGGAKLTVQNVRSVPDSFVLRFSLTSQSHRSCAVRWRGRDDLGVQFVETGR